jgi:hypothetical protein
MAFGLFHDAALAIYVKLNILINDKLKMKWKKWVDTAWPFETTAWNDWRKLHETSVDIIE